MRSKSVSNIDASRQSDVAAEIHPRPLGELREQSMRFPIRRPFLQQKSVGVFEKCIFLKGCDLFKHLDDYQVRAFHTLLRAAVMHIP